MALPTAVRVWSCRKEPDATTLSGTAGAGDYCISLDDGRIWQLASTGPNVWALATPPTYTALQDWWLSTTGTAVAATDPTAATLLVRNGEQLDTARAYGLGITS